MTLYHVDRGDLLMGIQKIELTKSDPYNNPYWETPHLFSGNDLQAHLETIYPDGLSYHGWKYLKERHTVGITGNYSHKVSYLTEMNLEYVRQAFYPKLHSRYQSIFAVESIEEAKIFRDKYGNPKAKIYAISTEDFVKVDMNYIFLGTQNVAGSFFGHAYWQGKSTNNPYFEYIVKLPATIIHEIIF
ncbi:hypothetical protein [Pedobacter hiemivivus]|uniref:DUF2441 domain-containing protein n=1 Tax=Pedobacter hiemivivus TaxID=2530454 RepID=A0A4R0NJR0_9SPHI|nr:hypothetical protein [Pedobacter hiemivivus]TCC99543.1 hypothetical protein EZ444_02380 [Pedobacter hiemivivus]